MGKIFGFIAMTLGAIGSLLSIAAAVAAVLFVVGASNVVNDVEDRITQPIDRLDSQIEVASASVASADGGELSVRLMTIADEAASASTAADAITEHPLFGNLPIDTASLETRLMSVAALAEEIGEQQIDEASGDDRSRISSSLEDLGEVLDGVDAAVQETGDSLRFWVRLSGLVFVALALWSLWAQVMLFGRGRQAVR